MDLNGARILVTGGSHRLGAEIAVALAAGGADVAISYRSSEQAAVGTCERIREHGVRAVQLRADLADAAQAEGVVHAAADALGQLDGVVHAASGGFVPKPLAALEPEDFEEAVGATLRGGLFLAKAGADRLSDGGAIVFIGDVAAVVGWPSFLPHSLAKSGLRSLTTGLARALAPKVRVSLVHPGTVLPEDGTSEEAVRELSRQLPLRRIGRPEDVTDAVCYLLCADYVTGTELVVDGGRLIR